VTDMKLPGMLYAAVLRSPYPHARILHIDVEKARALPGVRPWSPEETLPASWVPRFRTSLFWATDKVRLVGDAVAAVAAIDPDRAAEALSLIKVDYEPLPGFLIRWRR